jgi:hypothetical protein
MRSFTWPAKGARIRVSSSFFSASCRAALRWRSSARRLPTAQRQLVRCARRAVAGLGLVEGPARDQAVVEQGAGARELLLGVRELGGGALDLGGGARVRQVVLAFRDAEPRAHLLQRRALLLEAQLELDRRHLHERLPRRDPVAHIRQHPLDTALHLRADRDLLEGVERAHRLDVAPQLLLLHVQEPGLDGGLALRDAVGAAARAGGARQAGRQRDRRSGHTKGPGTRRRVRSRKHRRAWRPGLPLTRARPWKRSIVGRFPALHKRAPRPADVMRRARTGCGIRLRG